MKLLEFYPFKSVEIIELNKYHAGLTEQLVGRKSATYEKKECIIINVAITHLYKQNITHFKYVLPVILYKQYIYTVTDYYLHNYILLTS